MKVLYQIGKDYPAFLQNSHKGNIYTFKIAKGYCNFTDFQEDYYECCKPITLINMKEN